MTRSPWATLALRALVIGGVPLLGAVSAPKEAHASVSIAVLFDALVGDSTSVGVCTPVEQHAVWENGKIVTYTRVHVEEAVAGDLGTGSEAWVASLGGIVGDVGQVVDGEPTLHVGYPTLLFLRPDPAGGGMRVVTARAQGQFPVKRDAKTGQRTFVEHASVGALYAPRPEMVKRVGSSRLAADAIVGRPVEEATRDIADAWRRLHAH